MPKGKPLYSTIPFREVLQRYKQVAPLGMFFAPQNTGFFNSRMPNQAYRVKDGPVFFCTSEVENDETPRRYTVRRMDWNTGAVDTVGPFCQYDYNEAYQHAKAEATRHRHITEEVV